MGILSSIVGAFFSRRPGNEPVTETPPPDVMPALRLIEQGNYDKACDLLADMAALHPHSIDVLHNLGAALMLSSRYDDALTWLDKAIELEPKCWPALINAATIRLQLGENEKAVNNFRKCGPAQEIPVDAALVFARCLLANNQFSETLALLKPRTHLLLAHPDYWQYVGIAYRRIGLPNESIAAFRQAGKLQGYPTCSNAEFDLAVADHGWFGEAHALLSRVRSSGLTPKHILISHARVLELLGYHDAAKEVYRRILEESEDDAVSLTNLGNLLKREENFSEAERCYRSGLSAAPRSDVLHKNLANLLGRTLRGQEALQEVARSVSLSPRNPQYFSDLLFAQQYSNDLSLDDHRRASETWGKRFGPATPESLMPLITESHRPLRLGLISSSFRQHPVGFLALPGLEALSNQDFAIYCYANQVDSDSFTERFKNISARWKRVAHLSDKQLERVVKEDQIDILVEMSGHAAGHRLSVVAQRLAPVQVKWVGGQFNTLGIESMDYFLSDPIETPARFDNAFVEKVQRLPLVYACYGPPPNAPPVSPLPAVEHGSVTFGSLNKAQKLTPETIELWSKCLTAAPNSRLLLKGDSFGHQRTCDYAKSLFEAHGIERDRIELRGFTAHPELLETYNEIDIALDPTPYSGCLTTCEALYMGVPVVTLIGTTFAGRHSASFLTAVGLEDWIAEDSSAYVSILKAKCADLESLALLRDSLRDQMAKSPLCDKDQFGKDLGQALKKMWRNRVAEISGAST